MKVDVIGSNSLLFENLPPASQVPGRTYRVSNVGPAPGILLTSNGTKYRPAGGRQVLALRMTNPVTIQDLAEQIAERIGPFPGGLVRAGMQLRVNHVFRDGGIGTGNRIARLYAGPAGSASASGQFAYWNYGGSYINANGEFYSRIDVQSDGSANHVATASSASNAVASMAPGYQAQSAPPQPPLIDFSAPWEVAVAMQSAAEDAVNISSATWAGGIATFNTSAAHTLAVGDKTVTAGVTPAGYNGTFIVASVPTTTQFTVALAADPGTYSTGGTSSRISNMISQSYVLELVG